MNAMKNFPNSNSLSEQFIDIVPRAMWAVRSEMRLAAKPEFTVPQFRVLAQLCRGHLCLSEVAEMIGTSLPAMSRLVDGLVKKKLVSRLPYANDRRQVQLSLTSLGEKKFLSLRTKTLSKFEKDFSLLSESERSTLKAGLQVLSKVFVTVLFVVLAHHSSSWAAPTPYISVKLAVQQAIEKNPELRNSHEKENELEANIVTARASIFPTLTGNVLAQTKKDSVSLSQSPAYGGNSYNFYDVQIKLLQPLYTGGAFMAGLRSVEKQRSMQKTEFTLIQRSVIDRTLRAFYSVLFYEKRLERLVSAEKVQKDFLGVTQQRYRIGRSRLLDVLQQKTQLALLVPKITQAKNKMQIAASELATLMGENDAKEIKVTGSLDVTLCDLHALEPKKYVMNPLPGNLPEVVRIHQQLELFSDQRDLSLAKHFPQFSLFGNYGRTANTRTEILQGYSTDWIVGLQLSIPLFSGLSSFSEKRSLDSKQAQLEIEQTRLFNELSLAQVTAVKELETNQQNVTSSLLAINLSASAVEEAKKNYRLGTIDYFQFLTTQQFDLDALLSLDQAHYDLLVSWIKVVETSGHSLEEFVNQLDLTTEEKE